MHKEEREGLSGHTGGGGREEEEGEKNSPEASGGSADDACSPPPWVSRAGTDLDPVPSAAAAANGWQGSARGSTVKKCAIAHTKIVWKAKQRGSGGQNQKSASVTLSASLASTSCGQKGMRARRPQTVYFT